MQFAGLSTSYSGSVPRDQFLVQAFTAIEGEERVTAGDEHENRRLRLEDRRKSSRSRRPSTLHSFIVGEERLTPTEEEDEDDDDDFDNDEALDTESYVDGEPSSVVGTEHRNLLRQALASSTASSGLLSAPNTRRQSRLSINSRLGVPSSEHTPLLSSRRPSVAATLTPKPLQKVFQGSGGAKKVCSLYRSRIGVCSLTFIPRRKWSFYYGTRFPSS